MLASHFVVGVGVGREGWAVNHGAWQGFVYGSNNLLTLPKNVAKNQSTQANSTACAGRAGQTGRQADGRAGRELRIMIEKPLKQAGQRGVCVMCQLVRDGDEDEDEDGASASARTRAASLRPSVLNMRLDMQMFGQST